MFVPLFPFPVPIQHGSNTNYRPAPPAAPRSESRKCDLCKSRREKKTDSSTCLKVANRSGSVSEALFGGCGNAAGGTTCPPQGVQGHSPGTPLVPFVVKRKEPRVWAG